MLKGTFTLSTADPNYWDIQNFLCVDKNFGGNHSIIPNPRNGNLMTIIFETQGDTDPRSLEPGSWSVIEC